jgi:outer membrane protein W
MTRISACSVAALSVCILLSGAPELAAQHGETRVGGRLLYFSTNAESDEVEDSGSRIAFDSAWTLDFDTTWMLSQDFGLEWMITATNHSLDAVAGAFGGLDLGDVWIAESTLTLKYHVPMWGKWSPYAGLGVGGAYAFSSSVSDAAKEYDIHQLRSDLLSGVVVQAGVAYRYSRHWILNVDIKYAALSGDLRIKNESTTIYRVNTDLDPWIIGLGIAARF